MALDSIIPSYVKITKDMSEDSSNNMHVDLSEIQPIASKINVLPSTTIIQQLILFQLGVPSSLEVSGIKINVSNLPHDLLLEGIFKWNNTDQ